MEYSFINEMSTTTRHNHFVASLIGRIFPLFVKKEIHPLQENGALVYYGDKLEGLEELVDPGTIENKEEFISGEIYTLNFVQPDFLIFYRNEFIQDRKNIRTAGIPDLVVEVWSDGNKPPERDMKFRIYSSSDMCEHWYIEQDSNIVTCFKGKQQLNNQYITNILTTTTGLEFDLTHMAL